MIACVIAGAGSGERFSKSLPKQFCKINGETILSRTLEAFKCFPTVVAIRQKDEQYFRENYKDVLYVIGGATRQNSVKNGLHFLKENFPWVEYVLITDAARPFVSKELIQEIADELQKGEKAVIPALFVSDTLKKIEGNYIISTIPRENIVRAQTPQGFDFKTIYRLHIQFSENNFTDDSALCEYAGIRVKVIEGEARNIKITFPNDIP